MLLKDLLAQSTAVSTLERALQHDRLAQSYLLTGPSGVGKRAAALGLACARNCEAAPGIGCQHCAHCTRIVSGDHPDVRLFGPREEGTRNLPVEFIRQEVLPFTKFAPFEARTAFVIFSEADVCFPPQHAEAANAILKTIEEPRAQVVFILISDRPSRLLATIRSRCQEVRFAPLPTAVLQSLLAAKGVSERTAAPAIALSGGRADRALWLSEDDRSATMLEWAQRIDLALAQGRPAQLLDLAEELARHADRSLILDTLALYYRDIAASGLDSPDLLRFGHCAQELANRARELAPARAAARVARIEQLAEDLARNGNPEISLDALMFGMP